MTTENERLQKIVERTRKTNDELVIENRQLQAVIEKQLEALEFYANPDLWEEQSGNMWCEALEDRGTIAKQALTLTTENERKND